MRPSLIFSQSLHLPCASAHSPSLSPNRGGQIDPGRSADDLFPPGTGPLPGLVYPGTGSYTKRVATEEKVIDVQATVLCINWIAINQQVSLAASI